MRFFKGLANSILTYVPNMIHIYPNRVGLETGADGVGIVEVIVWGRGKAEGD